MRSLERKTLANISAVELGQLAEATVEERLVSPTNAIGLAMQAALRQMQAADLDTKALEQGLKAYKQLCSNLAGFRGCMIQVENKPLETDLSYAKTPIGREILDVSS